MSEFVQEFEGILFDLDGTLADSEQVVESAWRGWAKRHGFDGEEVFQYCLGKTAISTISHFAPHLDIEREVEEVTAFEIENADKVTPIPGALDLIQSLPPTRWGIVTSGSRPLATARLIQIGVPIPDIFITANDVSKGKPDPEPYQKGVSGLGIAPQRCVAVEDSLAGLSSIKGAGLSSIGITTAVSREKMADAGHADEIIDGYHQLKVEVSPSGTLLFHFYKR